jgi:hypothetical protein
LHDGLRVPSLPAAVLSAVGTIASGVGSIVFPRDTLLGLATALMATGFLYFVRRWMQEREAADREAVDTLRKHIEKQDRFEREVIHFMGQVQAHLGLRRYDSDPGGTPTDGS